MSWKQKIDPAFDRIIIEFIKFLDAFSLPNKGGYIRIDKETNTFKALEAERFPSMVSFYEKPSLPDFLIMLRELFDGDAGSVYEDMPIEPFSLQDLLKYMISELISKIEEGSKAYYEDNLIRGASYEQVVGLTLSPSESQMRVISDLFSLTFHFIASYFSSSSDVNDGSVQQYR